MRSILILLIFTSMNLKAEVICRKKPFGLLTAYNLSVLDGNFNDPKTADSLIKDAISSNRITKSDDELMFIYQNTNELKSFRGSDTEGSMLVSGNMYLKNYSVGHLLDRFENKILANGEVYIYPDTNYDRLGHLFTPTSIYGNQILRRQNFPFKQESKRMLQLSKDLFSLKNTGTVLRIQKSIIYLRGDSKSSVQVFTIEGDLLKDSRDLDFQYIPKDATIIINVIAPKTIAEVTGFIDLGFNQRKTIFNFDSRSEYTIHIHKVEVPGTVLAPSAQVFFSTGLIRGQVISRDFIGSGQINLDPFEGCLPIVR